MSDGADVVIAKSLFTQLDGDPDIDEETGGWLQYASKALIDLYAAGWRVTKSERPPPPYTPPPAMMSVEKVLYECLRHFAYTDEANAAMHTADVRYSPITFRVAESLDQFLGFYQDELVVRVIGHLRTYPEDTGR